MFVRMQRDAQVRACLTTKRLSVLSEVAEVHPADASGAAARAAAVVEEQLNGCRGGIAGIVTGALDALAMGWAVGEYRWSLAGALERIAWHDPRRFVLHGDDAGDVAGLELLDASLTFPAERFVLYTHQGRYGDPHGESDLVAAYEAYTRKQLLRRMWAVALDRFGSPTVLFRVPVSWSNAEMSDLAGRGAKLQNETCLVVTNDVEGELLDQKQQEPGAGFATAIAYEDTQIARSVLGQELTTQGSSGGSGSFALGKVHEGVKDDWIQALRSDLATCALGSVAATITRMALGPDAPAPVVKFPNLSPAELAGRRELITQLISGQVVAPSENWLRSWLGLPEEDKASPAAAREDALPKQQERIVPGDGDDA